MQSEQREIETAHIELTSQISFQWDIAQVEKNTPEIDVELISKTDNEFQILGPW